MNEYHKIDSLFKRDEKGKMLFGEWARDEFHLLRNVQWEFTEKVDGTNIRVMYVDGKVRVGGRTDSAQIPATLLLKLGELLPVEKLASAFDGNACLYGEGYGAKIQKGGGNYIADGVNFALFDVRVGDYWLKREDVYALAADLGITMVPVIASGNLYDLENWVARGVMSNLAHGHFAEGIVARLDPDLFDRRGRRIITKLKARDFQVPPGVKK